MRSSLHSCRARWPGACSFHGMAQWEGCGVTLALGDRCCPTRVSSSACSEDKVSGVLREPGVLGVCGRRWRRRRGRARVGWRRGVSVEVYMVFSQDKVLQRFVEQIIVDSCWAWKGSTALRGAGPRGAPRRCLTRVWWRRSPT